ncbi:Tex family protein [Enterococcus nangangensis]|uniref:Tex family protein n=1 Tax=Enterococcus nangangensis TaxID=2559926 RepID=UPI0010F7E5E2|nr:Tex family protein [Enterococcus nangangensis]
MTTEEQARQLLYQELQEFSKKSIDGALGLLQEGNTIPFIARYRKEVTGYLDEVAILKIAERKQYLDNLLKRKEDVLKNIAEQGKLTPALQKAIEGASQLTQVEDLYLPFKQKRRTKATIAKENGLEPLAALLTAQDPKLAVEERASEFLNEKVSTVEEALAGAIEILAEGYAENAQYRQKIRQLTRAKGLYETKEKDAALDEKGVYQLYYEFKEPLAKMVSHRILATNRGEKEGVLKVNLIAPEGEILQYLQEKIMTRQSPATAYLLTAINEAYKRFIGPSIERELRKELTDAAEEQAIKIFGENLKNLLLQPALKGKVVMGFDPAYRTGCKLAVVDATGKLLGVDVIYPHKPAPEAKRKAAFGQFKQLLKEYQVEMIAIGNGTASRESEEFVASVLKEMPTEIFYLIVSEAGASVYSASQEARDEFPQLQVEQRSAVSIARRIQDPLAELVKIDPQAVGVGQYQHDVSQKNLKEQLSFVVETAVNRVGVNLNTASAQLLQFVAGLNKTIAQNIITYREEAGVFTSRAQLKKVPRLGPKAFEQAVGFLRILNGKNPLDQTGIHPESYRATEALLTNLNLPAKALGTAAMNTALSAVDIPAMAEELSIGEATLADIIQQLQKPGRDIRDDLPQPLLKKDILKLEDLAAGMELEGTVRNVVDFGAFVDIGVKQDGLVHLSKLAKTFVKHPTDVVAVGDVVTVWVEAVDSKRGRISLTMIAPKKND